MKSDRLQELLSRADRAVARRGVPADLPVRAHRALIRRRLTRRATAGALAALLILWMLPSTWGPTSPRGDAGRFVTDSGGQISNQASELNREIRWRTALVTRLMELEAENALRGMASAVPAEPRLEARKQLEQAARTLVEAGDRLLIEERPALAAATYARVIDAFPSSTWAAAAGERMDRLRMR